MYTEYVFDDKKYEVASKNLKSILFDVVNAESSKLADIREKIAEADESDLRSKMIELCDKHERTLLSILNVSNKLNETLQLLDSFSRDLRFLENESLAEIVSHYVEQQNAIAAEQNASYVPEQENAVAAEQNASYVPERENAVAAEQNASYVPEQENAVAAEQNASYVPEQENAVAAEQNASYVPEQENAVAAEQNASYVPEQENAVDPITDAVDVGKVEENALQENDSIAEVIARSTRNAEEAKALANQETVEENNEEAIVEPPVAEEQVEVPEEDALVSDSNIVENANDNTEVVDEEAAAPIIESSEPVFPVTEEEKKEETITDIFGLNENGAAAVVDNPIIEESSDEVVPGSEEVSSDEESDVQVQDSVIPVVTESVNEENDKSDDLSPVDETVNSETTQDVIIPEINGTDNAQDSTLEKQEEIEPEVVTDSDGVVIDESEIITFVKADNNQPRAILTTANQVSKLRASKGTNESLLTAKQFFKFANQTETGVTVEQPVSESVEIANEGDVAVALPTAVETANSVAVEQPVAENNSNVLPFPIEKTKEEQMEEMMQQITELYNEGKVDEAQALSDKVSELNKELQQEQKVLVA